MAVTPTTTANAADNARMKILVVEDDKFLQKMLLMKFGAAGFDVRGAFDGAEAIHEALADPPDLILLDLILPKVNGFEVLSEVKASPKTRNVTVIVLSNLGQEEDIRRAKDLGAAEFMVKSNLSIHDVVEQVMQAYKRHTAAGEQ